MPTVLRLDKYRFFVFSDEADAPPHIRVDRGGATAKVWLRPAALACNHGFRQCEVDAILSVVTPESAAGDDMKSSAPIAGARVADVRCDDARLTVDLMDGRTIAVPLARYPRLLRATPAQRARWEASAGGYGIHWPEIDEDLSVEGLLQGTPAAGAA